MKSILLILLLLLQYTLLAQRKIEPFIKISNAPLAIGNEFLPNKTGLFGGFSYNSRLFFGAGFEYITNNGFNPFVRPDPKLHFITNAYSFAYRFLNSTKKVSPMTSLNTGYGIYSNGRNSTNLFKMWYYGNVGILTDITIHQFNLRVGPLIHYYVIKNQFLGNPYTDSNRGIGGVVEIIYKFPIRGASHTTE